MKFAALESARGIAALAVVWFHTPFLSGQPTVLRMNAELFVDFFFILSGFVMAHAYRDRILGGMTLRDYAMRRFGRLYPLHGVLMGAWGVMALGFLAWGGATWFFDINSLRGFFLNVILLNSVGLQDHLNWNFPAWSIGAEMIAYLAFFAVLRVLGRRPTWLVALALSLFAYAAIASLTDTTFRRSSDLGFLRCLGGFFLGVAVHALHERNPRPQRAATEIAVLAMVLSALLIPPGRMLSEAATFAGFAATVFVLASSTGPFARLLDGAVPRFLGRISYSVYMVHALVVTLVVVWGRHWEAFPTIVFATPTAKGTTFITDWAILANLGIVAVTVAISAVTYRFVEAPARDYFKRRTGANRALPVRAA
ncbi:MAG: acyltransferase [Rhodobacteraceae bacterium]|nr:acyltransferase [Paracoccaceae bacterium]